MLFLSFFYDVVLGQTTNQKWLKSSCMFFSNTQVLPDVGVGTISISIMLASSSNERSWLSPLKWLAGKSPCLIGNTSLKRLFFDDHLSFPGCKIKTLQN